MRRFKILKISIYQGESSKILNITNLEEPLAAFTSASIDLIQLVIQSNSDTSLSDSEVKYVLRRLVTEYSMVNGRVESDCPSMFHDCMMGVMANAAMGIQRCALSGSNTELHR
jgi:predicted metal-dependent enzyme (double-stranded beta helix superfamily)